MPANHLAYLGVGFGEIIWTSPLAILIAGFSTLLLLRFPLAGGTRRHVHQLPQQRTKRCK